MRKDKLISIVQQANALHIDVVTPDGRMRSMVDLDLKTPYEVVPRYSMGKACEITQSRYFPIDVVTDLIETLQIHPDDFLMVTAGRISNQEE